MAEEVSRLGERLGMFQALVENSPDAIVMTDAKGFVTYFSPGAVILSGWSVEEVLTMRADEFYAGGLEEAREVGRLLQEKGQLQNYQTSFKAKDGSLFEAYASMSMLHDADGEFSGVMAVWKDFSDRRQAEEALRDVNLTGADLDGAQLTNLISIEGADFTGVSSLSGESAEYLSSIAGGSHPNTFRQTADTLKDLSLS